MKTCFKNFTLIDGRNKEVQKDAFFMVDNDIIVEVGTNYCDDSDVEFEVIDLCEKYVMPGLIDCHTHIFVDPEAAADTVAYFENSTDVDLIVTAIKNLEKTIKGGVTLIRDVGGYNHFDIQLKKHIQSNSILAPDMYCAGQVVTMTGGHGHFIGREADGVDEVRKGVREQLKAGADLIKVVSSGGVMTPGVDVNAFQFNVDELKAAVEEAHKAGRKVATHSHSTQGIKNSITAGIDSIEHSTLLDDESIEMLVEKGTYIVPTLSAFHFILKNGEKAGIPKYAIEKAREISANHAEGFRKAYEAGANIAMGTDAGTPFNKFGDNHLELILMVEAGMSPMDAIITSTKNSAELIGVSEKYGTLESGKFADFLVLDENPADNINALENIKNIYKKGKKIK